MPHNKLALLRYKTIDQCLRNRFRKWTLEDLIATVSEALYEYEGIDSGVSLRTIQLDIQNMRSDKLGYNAPIVVIDKKYYTYSDKNYSILHRKLSNQDIDRLNDIVQLLGQFKGFNYFEDLEGMIGKLEAKIYQQKSQNTTHIDFEKNEQLRGLHWIGGLLKSIKEEQHLKITYQSFKAHQASVLSVNPYLLKEYRNRWFLLCQKEKAKDVLILALDRIQAVEIDENTSFSPATFDIATFFNDAIGVTKTLEQDAYEVVLKINPKNAPYVLTKPLHPSQKVIETSENYLIVAIQVVLNYELEREILGFGESIEVLSPRMLQRNIKKRLEKAAALYHKDA